MARSALIVVDMIQTYDFEDAEQLREHVEETIGPLERLLGRAQDEDVLTIYVNDNLGSWLSEREKLVDNALQGEFKHLVETVAPREEAMFIVKTRHSAFYETPLEIVLRESEVTDIVLAGQVTEQCILYSALDAHLRQIPATIVRDACAPIFEDLAEAALKMMERNMGAQIVDADDVRFSR
jgi:nicotinamidase-related amidase